MSTTFTRKGYRADLVDGLWVEIWYNPHERLWLACTRDKDGNQLDDVEYLFGARGIKEAVTVFNTHRPALKFKRIK